MKYIAVDFEWNQAQSAKQTRILGGDAIEAAEYNLLGALCATEEYKSNVLNTIIRPRLGRR